VTSGKEFDPGTFGNMRSIIVVEAAGLLLCRATGAKITDAGCSSGACVATPRTG
jgi:hypothetical protein